MREEPAGRTGVPLFFFKRVILLLLSSSAFGGEILAKVPLLRVRSRTYRRFGQKNTTRVSSTNRQGHQTKAAQTNPQTIWIQ